MCGQESRDFSVCQLSWGAEVPSLGISWKYTVVHKVMSLSCNDQCGVVQLAGQPAGCLGVA